MEICSTCEASKPVIYPSTDIVVGISQLDWSSKSIIAIGSNNISTIYFLDERREIIISIIPSLSDISESIGDSFSSWSIGFARYPSCITLGDDTVDSIVLVAHSWCYGSISFPFGDSPKDERSIQSITRNKYRISSIDRIPIVVIANL